MEIWVRARRFIPTAAANLAVEFNPRDAREPRRSSALRRRPLPLAPRLEEAVAQAVAPRDKPIVLTGMAAMLGTPPRIANARELQM
jgi:hypothetical protein